MLTDIIVEIMEGGSVPAETIRATCDAYAFGRTASQRRTLYRVVEVLANKTGTVWAPLADTPDTDIDAHFRDNLKRAAASSAGRPSAFAF
jgi:hypothetical protein